MLKFKWIVVSAGLGAFSLSFALASVPPTSSLPPSGRVTDDTVLYQSLSEIRVPRQGNVDFDQDVNSLASTEGHYREKLPSLASRPALAGAMKRIAQHPYHYSRSTKKQTATN